MSLPSTRNDLTWEMAPHLLHTARYSAQGTSSCDLLGSVPLKLDSVKYPAVDGQFAAYYHAPRVEGPASGAIGIFGGYRQTQSLEPHSPAPATQLPPLGRGFPPSQQLNYLGQPLQQ